MALQAAFLALNEFSAIRALEDAKIGGSFIDVGGEMVEFRFA